MRSRFKNKYDYFKTIDKVTAAARAFVGRAGKDAAPNLNELRGGKLRAAPAARPAEWDELTQAEMVYLVATDCHRVHVATAPAALAADVPLLRPQDGAHELLATATTTDGRRVSLNARYLREAIHPRANRVVLHVPDDTRGNPVIVASFIDDAQIALALVMSLYGSSARHDTVYPVAIAAPGEEVGDESGAPAG